MDAVNIHAAVNCLLECSICLQVYQDPRILPCGHTFCLKCIQSSASHMCPLCKRDWQPPINGFQGLSKNFVVENFISSLPSVSKCSLAGSNIHGQVEYFCVDCWDPLCEKCAKGHLQFSKAAKGHVIKTISEVNLTDIEIHNRQKSMLCSLHKNQEVVLYCIDCKQFSCTVCYALSHNKHQCCSVEEADTAVTEKLNESVLSLQKSITRQEDSLKRLMQSKISIDEDKEKIICSIGELIRDAKQKLQAEFDKLICNVDECYIKTVQVICERVSLERLKLDQLVKDTRASLQSLQDAVSNLKRHLPPLSSAVERAKLATDNGQDEDSLKTAEAEAITSPVNRLSDISAWKSHMNNWLMSCVSTLPAKCDIPILNIDDIEMVHESRPRVLAPQLQMVKSVEVTHKFSVAQKTGLRSNVLAVNNDQVLVSSVSFSELYIYKLDGHYLSTITLNDQLFDVKWTPRGNIVYTTYGSNKVVSMLQSGDILSQTQMTNPQHLSVSNDNVIYLTDYEAGIYQSTDDGITWKLMFKPTGGGNRWQTVKVINEQSDDFWTLEEDDNNCRLRIYNVNRSPCDGPSAWKDVNLPKINDKNIDLFNSKLAYDGSGNIFLNDYDNKAIHVLSINGQYHRQLVTSHYIDCPYNLAVDRGLLYVVQLGGKLKVFKLI